MTDRPLDAKELDVLRQGRTLTTKPYFIEVFKKDRLEDGGRNDQTPPTLYEMVLLELIAKMEVIEKVTTPAYINQELRKRSGFAI